MRTFEYRLYPNKCQHALLMQCLIESRQLYNEMLETVKQQYEDKGTFPTKYDLEKQFKGRSRQHVPATTVQTLADRLSKALKRFLGARELGQKVGFPRFTTQQCSQCGTSIQKSLSVRTHICTSCGFVADRDVNAAKNILSKAGALPSGTVFDGSPDELRSPRL